METRVAQGGWGRGVWKNSLLTKQELREEMSVEMGTKGANAVRDQRQQLKIKINGSERR